MSVDSASVTVGSGGVASGVNECKGLIIKDASCSNKDLVVDGLFPCEDCAAVFDCSKSLREHVAQHKWGPHLVIAGTDGQDAKFQCLFEGCGKIVKDRKVLRKHCLTHRPREFACGDCGKRFYERAKLKRHMLVHSGEKEFKCSFVGCDKTFAYKANLLTHLRTHTGHRPFKCTWPGCSKSFAQASNRNSHVLTHSASKRKRCKLSDSEKESCSSSDNLQSKHRKLEEVVKQEETPVSSPNSDQRGLPTISPSHRETIASLLLLSNSASIPGSPEKVSSMYHIPISPANVSGTSGNLGLMTSPTFSSLASLFHPQNPQPKPSSSSSSSSSSLSHLQLLADSMSTNTSSSFPPSTSTVNNLLQSLLRVNPSS